MSWIQHLKTRRAKAAIGDPLDKKGLWDPDALDENSGAIDIDIDDIQTEKQDVFLEEVPEPTNETGLFLAEDSPTTEMPLDEIEFFNVENTPKDPNDQELLLTLDDFPENESTSDPLASSQPKEDGITFELDDPFEPVNPPVEKGTLDKFDDIQAEEQDVFLEEIPDQPHDVDLFLEEDVQS